MHKMWTIVTDDTHSMEYLSVCRVLPAKTAQQIEVHFEAETLGAHGTLY